MSLLNHHQAFKDEASNSYNMVLMNNITQRESRPSPGLRRAGVPRRTTLDHTDSGEYSDNGSVICELLHHVKQINEELHSRNVNRDVDDHYKSEWRMVALVLDRILLIIFFIVTVFTSVVIFINVPH